MKTRLSIAKTEWSTIGGNPWWLLLSSTFLFSLSACKKTDYLDINAAERPALSAHISFVNARPVNAGLHFWTYITRVTSTPVAINTASPYLNAQFGDVQINATEGNNTSYLASYQFGNSATFSATGRPNGPIATYYHTVFAAKNAKSTADTLILFYDDLTVPVAGKAKVRFVHLAPGLPNVNVGLEGQNTLFADVPYGRAGGSALSGETVNAFSLGPFTSVEAGVQNFSVSKANDNSVIDIQNHTLQNLSLQAGKIYTIFTHGIPGNPSAVGASVITHQQ